VDEHSMDRWIKSGIPTPVLLQIEITKTGITGIKVTVNKTLLV
jgi:hypothetical protein